jgi:mono/diheme cytochrome c family protein
MTRSLRIVRAVAGLATLLVSTQVTMAAPNAGAEGKVLLEQNCSRCHSIADKGGSPLAKAPPLRDIYLRYPIQQLEQGFAEGMGSRHRDMPQIQFSDDQVAAILAYLGSITGVDPATRPRAPVEDETPP